MNYQTLRWHFVYLTCVSIIPLGCFGISIGFQTYRHTVSDKNLLFHVQNQQKLTAHDWDHSLCTSQVAMKIASSLFIYHNIITLKGWVIIPVSYKDLQLRKYVEFPFCFKSDFRIFLFHIPCYKRVQEWVVCPCIVPIRDTGVLPCTHPCTTARVGSRTRTQPYVPLNSTLHQHPFLTPLALLSLEVRANLTVLEPVQT